MPNPIEKELIKITAYKARTKFADRQDYLGSILNAVMKLSDSDFDDLSDEAATWANAAVEAKNGKSDIPDFDEVGEADADAADEDADDEADDSGDDSEDGDGDTASDDDDDTDPDDGDDAEDDEASEDGDDEPAEDDEPEDDEPEEKPAKKKPAKAAVKAEKPAKEKPAAKPAKEKGEATGKKKGSFGRDDDVVLDKWGCMEGSKNARALNMFEKGATAKEVKDDLGGTYYNILKRVVQDGHTLEKDGAIIKITHKDEKGKKAAPKPAAKAPVKKAAKK